MPNLLNQSKHEEFEPKLALQIRNQEQSRSRREAEEEWKKNRTRNFAPGCENSHWCEFSHSAKLLPCANCLSPLLLTF